MQIILVNVSDLEKRSILNPKQLIKHNPRPNNELKNRLLNKSSKNSLNLERNMYCLCKSSN